MKTDMFIFSMSSYSMHVTSSSLVWILMSSKIAWNTALLKTSLMCSTPLNIHYIDIHYIPNKNQTQSSRNYPSLLLKSTTVLGRYKLWNQSHQKTLLAVYADNRFWRTSITKQKQCVHCPQIFHYLLLREPSVLLTRSEPRLTIQLSVIWLSMTVNQ